ncbi:MAG: penicillin acylase family protein [Gemmatimonadales bacterium]
MSQRVAHRSTLRLFRLVAVGLVALSCTGITDDLGRMQRASLSQLTGTIPLAGLQQDVEVLRDSAGIAHIYAKTVDDLFFAQGFVAAQDRLWQLEIWRRIGEGRLSEIVGPATVERDRLARLLKYRGDMEAEWTSYHADGKRIITAFVNGINAYIEHRRDNLPVEFKLTGIVPDPWTPEVPIMRMAGLPMTRNALAELRLARSVAQLGVAEANRRDNPDPPQKLTVPPGLDVSQIPREVLTTLASGYAGIPRIPVLEKYRRLIEPFDTDNSGDPGSNNWVVSGAMTATGKPMLANDPHRSITLPSLRYLVHLNAPGWNVIGSGEPALPGVAIGHNERIAWGLTIVGIDQQDVFVEELNPENPDEVRWQNGWDPLESESDTIYVKGEDPRPVTLQFSRHGPIVYKDIEHNKAYAFKSVLAEAGTAGYLGSLRVDQASNWREYLNAMEHWLVPSENLVYADVDGNIGWQAAGMTPIRCCGWVGRLPVPGSGRYDWRGFRPTSKLPREFNPARGYIATANHNIMPNGYSPPLGYRWASPVRYLRLDDVLSDSGGFTVQDFERLQYDEYSSTAAKAVRALRGWTSSDEKIERAREMLAEWDAVMDRGSAEAALYHAWRAALDGTALAGNGRRAMRDSVAERALAVAIDSLERSQGSDWSKWRWGAMHKTHFTHPITAAFDLPDVERGGDRTTVNVTGQSGASFREIIDLSNWDNSVGTSTPGQSGQPGSPHYSDLRKMWGDGRYFSVPFSRKAVEAKTRDRLVLKAR